MMESIDLNRERSKQTVGKFVRLINSLFTLPLSREQKISIGDQIGDLLSSAERDAFLEGVKAAEKGVDVVVDEEGVRNVIQ